MIRLSRQLFARLDEGDVGAVRASLQSAIDLEHATIPPYLYAMYSLVPGTNDPIAETIESVIVEEMLHLALASNVLNALGGEPVLAPPAYPGPLPGAIESGLVVGLAPFSIDLVGDVFMVIEEPEHPLDFPVGAVGAPMETLTIGAFYRRIKATIAALGDGVFVTPARHQIGPDRLADAVVVTDVATAGRAIDTIIDQGEGTSTEPLQVVGQGYAHYYRFGEIFNGRRLVPNPDAGPDTPPDTRYIYGGDPMPFDPAGVYPVPSNPTASGYPAASGARIACDTFNYTYTSLLKVLQAALSGAPEKLDAALGLMFSLEQQAKDMMTGYSTAGAPTGPSFEHRPVN
ncbi:MAG: ferritin-like domain-containing protein [Acidimicrobiales bacterium]